MPTWLADVAEWLGAWPGAAWLRGSGLAYLLVNAAHILGIALLVGAILPLDLRVLGLFRSAPLAALAPVLVRSAGFGLCIAVATGAWLVSVKPTEYFGNPAFQVKAALLALAALNIALQHAAFRWAGTVPSGPPSMAAKASAAVSAFLWMGVLLAGRWIGFA